MHVGAAQDMMTSGIGIRPVMQAGGWRSMNIDGRYVQEASFLQNGITKRTHLLRLVFNDISQAD
jgi:hypothetical protein